MYTRANSIYLYKHVCRVRLNVLNMTRAFGCTLTIITRIYVCSKKMYDIIINLYLRTRLTLISKAVRKLKNKKMLEPSKTVSSIKMI